MKPHERDWRPSPADNDDITPRVWEETTGRLVAHVATDAETRLIAAAPAMARALLAHVNACAACGGKGRVGVRCPEGIVSEPCARCSDDRAALKEAGVLE